MSPNQFNHDLKEDENEDLEKDVEELDDDVIKGKCRVCRGFCNKLQRRHQEARFQQLEEHNQDAYSTG